MDTFIILVDRRTGKKRGIGFLRFKSKQEALSAIALAQGRSWGGRRISVTLARPLDQLIMKGPNSHPLQSSARRISAWVPETEDAVKMFRWEGGLSPPYQDSPKSGVGWVVKLGQMQVLKVAPWVLHEGMRLLHFSLVGFLKPCLGRVSRVESWL